jgi:hypothetical protein
MSVMLALCLVLLSNCVYGCVPDEQPEPRPVPCTTDRDCAGKNGGEY